MAVLSFTISTERIGPRRWCWVRVHPNAEHLRAAAQRLNSKASSGDWEDTVGCFQPAWTDCKTSYAGTLRLAEGWVTPEIVAHELVHAALTVYRINVHPDVRLGNGCRAREEDLAYIYGELSADMRAKLGT
jgi:hypothetical protein